MTKFTEHRNGRRPASKDIVVLYHAECTDGFVAAWIAWTKLGEKAQYIPVENQVPPPEGLTGREIYLLDISYKSEIMERLLRDNRRIVALDHHVTAEAETKMATEYRYATDKSGASIAWEYFRPGEPMPYLVRIVEDMDIFRLALPDTLALFDWLDLFDFEFKRYSRIARQLDTPTGLRRALRDGNIVKTFREQAVRRLVHNASYAVQFGEHRVLAVTTEIYHHEVANALAQGRPFGIAWRIRRNGVYVSLRSDANGIHVGEFARRFGGGGHAHAAGFLVPTVADLPFSPVKE